MVCSGSHGDLLLQAPVWQAARAAPFQVFQRQLWYHISDCRDCQALFLKFLRTFRFPFSSARPFLDGKWYNITSFFHMQVLFQEIFKFFISDPVPFLLAFSCESGSCFRKKKLISRSSRKLTLGVLISDLRSGERGIWTLAPVSRPTPLAGAPLQPLEYFSSPDSSNFYMLFTSLLRT